MSERYTLFFKKKGFGNRTTTMGRRFYDTFQEAQEAETHFQNNGYETEMGTAKPVKK